MREVSGITRMNLASMDDEGLASLREEITGLELFKPSSIKIAADLVEAIDEEISLRIREPM